MNNFLKWQNLIKNKCPQCGKDWFTSLRFIHRPLDNHKFETMFNHGCGFNISEKRYKQIVHDRVIDSLEDEEVLD